MGEAEQSKLKQRKAMPKDREKDRNGSADAADAATMTETATEGSIRDSDVCARESAREPR
eukprot:6195472-Pleurochrysis_carterae.AAC.2